MRIDVWMLAGLLIVAVKFADGQETVPYDGLRAGDEAHHIGEAQRQQRLNDQLYLNDAMRARYGWATSGDSVVWYGNAAAGYGRPLGIDYAYAYSSDRLLGRRGRSLYIERYWSPPLGAFEPWPYIPGDIYGYYFPPSVRQPIGQRQIQTGPTRWESHPVYSDELAPSAEPDLPADERLESPMKRDEAPAKSKPRRYYF